MPVPGKHRRHTRLHWRSQWHTIHQFKMKKHSPEVFPEHRRAVLYSLMGKRKNTDKEQTPSIKGLRVSNITRQCPPFNPSRHQSLIF
jgi:hypothetical protein